MEINKPVVIIITLIINLILIFLFVIPRYQESSDLQSYLVQKQAEYSSQSDYYIELLSILKNIEDRKDILEKIDSALPSRFSLASLLYFFQKESLENQLIIKSVTFPEVLPGNNSVSEDGLKVKNVKITMNLSGSYQGLKGFLSSLDRSDRLFQVENIVFASPGFSQDKTNPQGNLDKYDFKLEVKTQTY